MYRGLEIKWSSEEDRRVAFELLKKLADVLLKEGEILVDYMPFGKYGYAGYLEFLRAVEEIAKAVCCSGMEKPDLECRYSLTLLYKIYPDGTTEIYVAKPIKKKLFEKPVIFQPKLLETMAAPESDEYIAWFLLQVVMRVCEAKTIL